MLDPAQSALNSVFIDMMAQILFSSTHLSTYVATTTLGNPVAHFICLSFLSD